MLLHIKKSRCFRRILYNSTSLQLLRLGTVACTNMFFALKESKKKLYKIAISLWSTKP